MMMFLKLFYMAVALLLLLIVAPFVYICSQVLLVRWKYRHLPGPKVKSFLLGHVKYFLDIEESGGHYSMLVVDWMKQHGSVFVLFLVNNARVICIEPSIVKELLVSSLTVKPKSFYGGIQSLFGESFLGDAVFTQLDNAKWMKQRRALNPAFKMRSLMNSMSQYNASCNELITVLESKAAEKSQKVYMMTELNKVTMDIIAKVALGMDDLKVIDQEDTPFSLSVDQTLQGIMMQLQMSYFSHLDPRQKSRKSRDVARKANKLIRSAGRKCIIRRLRDMQDGKECPQDILAQILKTYIAGQKVTEQEIEKILNEFTTFFVGGAETSTPLMAFTIEIAGRHPEIYKKLQEEVDKVLGDKESVTYDDTVKLEYMNLVYKEVLRMIPPVPAVHRINENALVINGVTIPARSSIELNTYAIGRDERFWEEPDKFNPERFKSDTGGRNQYAYFPFSLGSRMCIGQNFAMIESKVVLAKIFQIFDYTLVPGVELQYVFEGVIKSKNKTPVYLTRRQK